MSNDGLPTLFNGKSSSTESSNNLFILNPLDRSFYIFITISDAYKDILASLNNHMPTSTIRRNAINNATHGEAPLLCDVPDDIFCELPKNIKIV